MFKHLTMRSLWPHRDVLINQMNSDYKKHFPRTLIILDAKELRCETPSCLTAQSQCYSEYKSHTTLKGMVGCDSRGNLMYVSDLYSGSISDKELLIKDVFFDVLQAFLDKGWVKKGDGVLTDKGILIKDQLSKLGIELNMPPIIRSDGQMTIDEIHQTQKVARHRIHVERLISKISKFLIIKHEVPASLYVNISKIWQICSILTTFQNSLIPKEN